MWSPRLAILEKQAVGKGEEWQRRLLLATRLFQLTTSINPLACLVQWLEEGEVGLRKLASYMRIFTVAELRRHLSPSLKAKIIQVVTDKSLSSRETRKHVAILAAKVNLRKPKSAYYTSLNAVYGLPIVWGTGPTPKEYMQLWWEAYLQRVEYVESAPVSLELKVAACFKFGTYEEAARLIPLLGKKRAKLRKLGLDICEQYDRSDLAQLLLK